MSDSDMQMIYGTFPALAMGILIGLVYIWHDYWYMPRQRKKKEQQRKHHHQ
ncbi:MAG: hypothetical protein Q7S68_03140 [Deltaproteobacteria bacterium]|nr:hypothetical protein [Deltaproteobacteria bacterium]